MKRINMVCGALLLFTVFAYGQNETANYAGTWSLDVGKSEMGERARIKSMTMTVTQSASELTYDRAVEREASDGEGFGGRGGMGGGGMRGPGGDQSATFSLDGKETTANGEMGSSKLKAKTEKAVLKLTQERTLDTQMGAITLKTTEKWSLSEDGKTLTVSSETTTPRGARNSKMIFTRKSD